MTDLTMATCPHCTVFCESAKGVIRYFGLRKKPEGIRVQSWCKECRRRAWLK